jgi:hypothetical protein
MGTPTDTTWGRATIAAVVVSLFALLLAGSATAAPERTVRDPRFDTSYLSKHGRLDITKATAARGLSIATHSVTTRAKLKPARTRERPTILINTRGGRRSNYEFAVFGSTVFRVPRQGRPVGVAAATLVARKRTWRYRFDIDDVPGLGAGYGWAAATQRPGGRLADVAPDGGYVGSP